MIWLLLILTAGGLVWFLLQPRRLQTIENVPAVVDEQFDAHDLVESTEDPRELRPGAEAAAHRAADRPVEGHGDSLTFDWPQEAEQHDGTGKEGPLIEGGEVASPFRRTGDDGGIGEEREGDRPQWT